MEVNWKNAELGLSPPSSAMTAITITLVNRCSLSQVQPADCYRMQWSHSSARRLTHSTTVVVLG